MKFAPVVILALTALPLAGCQTALTLAEAQAQCDKQGGLLVVIYTEKITRSSVGPVVASPGSCVSPNRFDKDAAVATPAASPQAAPSAAAAPAAGASPAPATN